MDRKQNFTNIISVGQRFLHSAERFRRRNKLHLDDKEHEKHSKSRRLLGPCAAVIGSRLTWLFFDGKMHA